MNAFNKRLLYPYILDQKPRFFLGWFLYRLFKKVHVDENMIQNLRQMKKDGTVIYAIKYRGKLDYLLYHYNFRRNRMPYPKIAFDLDISMLLPLNEFVKALFSKIMALLKYRRIPSPYQSGFYKEAIQQGTTSLIFLIDPKKFIRRFIHSEDEPIHFLLSIQQDMARPIYIVPQLILYKRTPEKDSSSLMDILFGFKDKPGAFRKIGLFFRHNRRAVIDFGEPLNLQDYISAQSGEQDLKNASQSVREKLIESIDKQKRVILGPIMKSRQQLKEIVLQDRSINDKIEKLASTKGQSKKDLRKKAGACFDEIAADYNATYIHLFHRTLSLFWKKNFEGVDVDNNNLAVVREWARKGPVIYVPSHKSHIDYLVLNFVLYAHHMHIPRVAAGRNLAFWPMGHIFRKCGAFFIRRTFRGQSLYVEVFNHYIKTLLQEGHPIEFFIEGGRSRNGKLILPKTGFLSILMQAYKEGFCEDLIFVPTSIVYDRVLEEKSYLKEMGGKAKENESFSQMFKARRFLKRKYGKIYIRFHEPFSVQDHLGGADPTSKDVHRNLALDLVRSINAVTLVTPLALVATAILTNHRKGFQPAELIDTVKILTDFLQSQNVPLTDTVSDPQKVVYYSLSILMNWKIVENLEDLEGGEEPFYYVDDDKKIKIEYYKNNIIHYFIEHGLIALSLLSGTEEIKKYEAILSDYIFLSDLLKNEFILAEGAQDQKIRDIIKTFHEAAYVEPVVSSEGYRVSKRGFSHLPIWANLAKTFLESYWIAFKSINLEQKAGPKKEKLLRHMDYVGKRYFKLGVIDHIGAISQINFNNALSLIHEFKVRNDELNGEKQVAQEALLETSQRIYELSRVKS